MKKVIYLELKKIFCNKLFLFIILLGLIFNGFVIVLNDKERVSNEFNNGYMEIYENVAGLMTQEKYNYLSENYERLKELVDKGNYDTENPSDEFFTKYAFGDLNAFEELINGYLYAINYYNNIENAINIAVENQKLYKDKDDIRINNYFIDSFQNRQISYYYNTNGMTKYLSHDFSSFIIILLVVIAYSDIFSEEVETGQSLILYTTVKGRKKLYLYKLITVYMSTFILSFIFFVSDFIIYNYILVIDGYFNPIYSLPCFQYAYNDLNILEYIFLSTFVKIVVFMLISTIVYLISFLTNKVINSVILSLCVLLILICFSYILINPLNLIWIRQSVMSFQIINFFNIYISKFNALICIAIVEWIMLLTITIKFICRKKGENICLKLCG